MYRFYSTILETEEKNQACLRASVKTVSRLLGVGVVLATGLPAAVNAQSAVQKQARRWVQEQVQQGAQPADGVPAAAVGTAPISTLSAVHATLADDVVTEGTQSYTALATRAGTGLTLSLRETPQAVTVVTRQRMEDQNMLSVKDVMTATPGISVRNQDSERYSFYSRGFFITNYLYDGIPTTYMPQWAAGESQMDPIIYDRVEVVRGATGLLTGAGNPSASVNLVRKRADSRQFKADLSLGAGSFDTYRATTDLSTPLTTEGNVRGRLVAAYQKNRSFLDRYHSQRSLLYGTVEADLSSRTVLRLGFNYQRNAPRVTTAGGFPLWYADGGRTNWDRKLNVGADWSRWTIVTTGAFADLEHAFDNGWKFNAMLSYSKHRADFTSQFMTGFPDRKTGLGMFSYPSNHYGFRRQHSADLKVSGPIQLFGRQHELIVGASLSRQRTVFHRLGPLSVPAIGNFLQWDGSYPEPRWGEPVAVHQNLTRQSGVYVATRLNLSDALNVILGGRYTQWSGDQTGYSSHQFRKNAITPYAGILYDLSDSLTAYFSYTGIFNPQEAQDRHGRWLDPLEGRNYEAGIKGSFLDGRLTASAAVFQTDQDNLKQKDTGYFVPGTTEQAYVATNGTRSRGYDLELSGEPLAGWNIMTGLTHWTARDGNGNVVLSEQPRTLFKLFMTYRLAGRLQGLTLGGGVTWQSSYYAMGRGPKGSERVSQGAYALVDLMARYQLNHSTSLQVNLNNLFNKKYYDQIGFYSQGSWGAPRNVMATLSYKY
ncbi:putative TonB-dependent outer membrane ferripyoverdine receptor [Advenella mimigardefordensis DPN7]|uniref:Putative TonB-dependent outer membrane ferripyoverdine receptor n=1 Tax=Advenella mimigardefordensis (strain DSM 17166 / LMG 22922 / DPN7) TaxID=1247726 RepID=W0PGC2_ADVMD|nr:putative TonB-dependent outer membrane ferripyoverdine receptor [Advenella mimigardefordensis DPN7]